MALIKSFWPVMEKVKSTLESDAGLLAFCNSAFNKPHKVFLRFRKRGEIRETELPLFMITRPGNTVQNRPNMRGRITHTLYVYCLFRQADPDVAVQQIVEIEEYIDQALLKDIKRGGLAVDTRTLGMENDEGFNHPVYALVKEVEIIQEVDQTAR